MQCPYGGHPCSGSHHHRDVPFPEPGSAARVRPAHWIGPIAVAQRLEHRTLPTPESFPIDKIHIPEKKRKALKPEMVEALAESILEAGQRDAILIRRDKDHFVLVDGLHRLEACKALGEPAIKALLISAEAARQHELPPPPPNPEQEKMERLRKLRLEKEAAEAANTSRAASTAGAATRPQWSSNKTSPSKPTTSSKPSRSGQTGAAPKTLSDWIRQQERTGGRY